MPATTVSFPALSLAGLDGRPRVLPPARPEGAALILIGHRDCETTRLTLPYVDRLARRVPPDRVVAVLQDDEASARSLVRELGLRLPVLLEPEPYPLAAALALTTVPTLFLVEPDGRVAERHEGFRRDALEALAVRLEASPLFGPGDEAPLLRPG